jgi:hypothetical protein
MPESGRSRDHIVGGAPATTMDGCEKTRIASDSEWFDMLVIDEASQVQVAAAAAYFCF